MIFGYLTILQTSRPRGTNLWPKFEIFTVLGAVFPHFCPDKREIWHGYQISRLLGQRVVVVVVSIVVVVYLYSASRSASNAPLRGEKPIFEPLSKNNTGMAPLRAGLPVKKHDTFSSTTGARPRIPTILGMVIEEDRAIFAPLTFLIRSVVLPLGTIENLWENAPTAAKWL